MNLTKSKKFVSLATTLSQCNSGRYVENKKVHKNGYYLDNNIIVYKIKLLARWKQKIDIYN